jgi:hypothetical protein
MAEAKHTPVSGRRASAEPALAATPSSPVPGLAPSGFDQAQDETPAIVKVQRLFRFMGEQEEREAVAEWLRRKGDSEPFSPVWRAFYAAADEIELGKHRIVEPGK